MASRCEGGAGHLKPWASLTQRESWKAHAPALWFPPREGQPEARAHLETSWGGWAFCARAGAGAGRVARSGVEARTPLGGYNVPPGAWSRGGWVSPAPPASQHFGMLQPETTSLHHPFAFFRCQAATLVAKFKFSRFYHSYGGEKEPRGFSGLVLFVETFCDPSGPRGQNGCLEGGNVG